MGPKLVRRFAILALVAAALPAAAEDARELLVESEARHRSQSQDYAGELTVTTREGKVRKKAWRSHREGYAGDARLLIRFLDPPEVRGVGFLSLARAGKNPDQWLYLPSMKRERRIASQDREASFVGTDFNYEDMEEFDHTKYEVELKGEESVGGEPCWIIAARPKEKSLYERRLLALRKTNLYLARIESFRAGEKEPAKRLELGDIAQVEGHWVARRMVMRDQKKGSHTEVVLKELGFDRPQPADRFTLQNLNREEAD